MSRITIIFYFILIITNIDGDRFDPSKLDYCSLSCASGGKHTACKCKKLKDVDELLNKGDINDFRTQILDKHNYYRNRVASGEATTDNTVVVSAANMNALNYDAELEYIARCLVRNFAGHNFFHDKCRQRHNGIAVGQNIYGESSKKDILGQAVAATTEWYDNLNLNLRS